MLYHYEDRLMPIRRGRMKQASIEREFVKWLQRVAPSLPNLTQSELVAMFKMVMNSVQRTVKKGK